MKKAFFAAVRALGWDEDERRTWMFQYTGKSSLAACTLDEIESMITALRAQRNARPAPAPTKKQISEAQRTRGRRIIHLLCLLGYTTTEGKPDYTRINAWCEGYTACKKKLWEQSNDEMKETLRQVTAWYNQQK